jgi:carboxyl-terminal processing protease
VAAYYFQSGAIENSLRTDKQFAEAIALLRNGEKYNSILQKK